MADLSSQPSLVNDAETVLPQGSFEHHIVFLLDVDGLSGYVKRSGSSSFCEDHSGAQASGNVARRGGDGGFAPDRLAEVFTRISQVYAQIYGFTTAVSYHMISTKSRFTQEKIDALRAKIACHPALAEVGAGSQSGGGYKKAPETRTPFNVLAEMYALMKALSEPPADGMDCGPSSSSWLENVGHHVQQTASRFVMAMNAAAVQRGTHVKAATFVLMTPAPQQGRPVKPIEPLSPELLSALRQVNARFMWLDPAGGSEVAHKKDMEFAVEAAAASVVSQHAVLATESALAEIQLALMLSSHWRLDGAAVECMALQPAVALPLLPMAWLPIADVFRSKAVLETIVRRIVAMGPPGPYGPVPATFNLTEFHGYISQFTCNKWWQRAWMETTELTATSYLRAITGHRDLKLPPLRIRADPHKAAAAAKAATAVAMKGAWQKRCAPGSQNPRARPPMAPPAVVPGTGLRPGAPGTLTGRPGPLTASAQINISSASNGRQPLKVPGLGIKAPGSTPGGRLPTGNGGPGGASRPQKAQEKINKVLARTVAADPAVLSAATNNYTLGRAAGKRIAQALEQGALTGAGAGNAGSKSGNDSQGTTAAGNSLGGALGVGLGGGTGSRWVWPPLSAEELVAQAAREGDMVAVDDQLDVGELLRQADEQMHEFISGELQTSIRLDEKRLRRAQRQQQLGQRKDEPQSQQSGPASGGHLQRQGIDGRSAKRQRIDPLETLQPVLGDARSRLRSKLLVTPAKLSQHEERLPGWEPPVELVLEHAREHTQAVVDKLLRASERAVSVAMCSVKKQAAERRARLKSGNQGPGTEMGEQCGEVDPAVGAGSTKGGAGNGLEGATGAGGVERQSAGADAANADQDGVYAAAIDQVFALLQEAWAGDMMTILRERGAIRGRPRLQLCALMYSASRFIHAVEMLGYRRRSPRALVDLLREQLDWTVPLLCHVEGAPSMATFVSERLKSAWGNTWAATLLDLLAVSYAGEDREGNNEMEFVARWDSDEDWEAGMEDAGGVEAATDALEELQRAAVAVVTQQQGSQLDASEPRVSGRAASVSHGRQGTGRNASASGGGAGAGGRVIRPTSGSGRRGAGSGAAGGGTGPTMGGTNAAVAGKAGPSQPQVMEVDSLRGVVVAGSQRPVGLSRMAKHVARLDPVRPAHMMPAIIARPIIQVAPDPPPERLAVLREEHRLKHRCGMAAANLTDLFDKEAPTPAAAAGGALAPAAPAVVTALPSPMVPLLVRAQHDRGVGRTGPARDIGAAGGPDADTGGAPNRFRGSPAGAPALSESSTEVGPTPMDDSGRHRSRLHGLEAAASGGRGLARGLFTDADANEVPTVKFNPGGEGVFSQVATFQIVKKQRAVSQPLTAAVDAAALHQSQLAAPTHQAPVAAVATCPALFVFGADVTDTAEGVDCEIAKQTCLASEPSSNDSKPPDHDNATGAGEPGIGMLRPPGGVAVPFSGLDREVTGNGCMAGVRDGAEAQAEVDGDLASDEREGPPSGCRLQAEEHSADSLLCPPRGDDDDYDSEEELEDESLFQGPGRRPPCKPVPDACSPSGKGTAARRATCGASLRLNVGGGNSRIPICAPGANVVPPRSRKAPPGAAAAASAAAATAAAGPTAKRGFRPGVVVPPPPRFAAKEADRARQTPRDKRQPPALKAPVQAPPNVKHPNAASLLAVAEAASRPLTEALDPADGCAPMPIDRSCREVGSADGEEAPHRSSLDSEADGSGASPLQKGPQEGPQSNLFSLLQASLVTAVLGETAATAAQILPMKSLSIGAMRQSHVQQGDALPTQISGVSDAMNINMNSVAVVPLAPQVPSCSLRAADVVACSDACAEVPAAAGAGHDSVVADFAAPAAQSLAVRRVPELRDATMSDEAAGQVLPAPHLGPNTSKVAAAVHSSDGRQVQLQRLPSRGNGALPVAVIGTGSDAKPSKRAADSPARSAQPRYRPAASPFGIAKQTHQQWKAPATPTRSQKAMRGKIEDEVCPEKEKTPGIPVPSRTVRGLTPHPTAKRVENGICLEVLDALAATAAGVLPCIAEEDEQAVSADAAGAAPDARMMSMIEANQVAAKEGAARPVIEPLSSMPCSSAPGNFHVAQDQEEQQVTFSLGLMPELDWVTRTRSKHSGRRRVQQQKEASLELSSAAESRPGTLSGVQGKEENSGLEVSPVCKAHQGPDLAAAASALEQNELQQGPTGPEWQDVLPDVVNTADCSTRPAADAKDQGAEKLGLPVSACAPDQAPTTVPLENDVEHACASAGVTPAPATSKLMAPDTAGPEMQAAANFTDTAEGRDVPMACVPPPIYTSTTGSSTAEENEPERRDNLYDLVKLRRLSRSNTPGSRAPTPMMASQTGGNGARPAVSKVVPSSATKDPMRREIRGAASCRDSAQGQPHRGTGASTSRIQSSADVRASAAAATTPGTGNKLGSNRRAAEATPATNFRRLHAEPSTAGVPLSQQKRQQQEQGRQRKKRQADEAESEGGETSGDVKSITAVSTATASAIATIVVPSHNNVQPPDNKRRRKGDLVSLATDLKRAILDASMAETRAMTSPKAAAANAEPAMQLAGAMQPHGAQDTDTLEAPSDEVSDRCPTSAPLTAEENGHAREASAAATQDAGGPLLCNASMTEIMPADMSFAAEQREYGGGDLPPCTRAPVAEVVEDEGTMETITKAHQTGEASRGVSVELGDALRDAIGLPGCPSAPSPVEAQESGAKSGRAKRGRGNAEASSWGLLPHENDQAVAPPSQQDHDQEETLMGGVDKLVPALPVRRSSRLREVKSPRKAVAVVATRSQSRAATHSASAATTVVPISSISTRGAARWNGLEAAAGGEITPSTKRTLRSKAVERNTEEGGEEGGEHGTNRPAKRTRR